MITLQSVQDALLLLSQTFIVVIAIVTIIDYLRYRDQARLDIALMFTPLGIGFLAGIVDTIINAEDSIIGAIPLIAFATQPYMLLRLTLHFGEVPKNVMRRAFWAFIISIMAVSVFFIDLGSNQELGGAIAFLILFISFASIQVYASYQFIRQVRTSTGLLGNRLRFVALGTVTLALLFVLFIVAIILAAVFDIEGSIIDLFSAIAIVAFILSYFLGFAPPAYLRRLWQLTELRSFLDAMQLARVEEGNAKLAELLTSAATRAVGGSVGRIALWDQSENQLRLLSGDTLNTEQGLIAESWHSQKVRFSKELGKLGNNHQLLMQGDYGQAAFVVPITLREQRYGVLFILLPYRSLFPDDDINLLTLFAEQSAIAFYFNALLSEQKQLNEQLQDSHDLLEERVSLRTADLAQSNRDLEKARAAAELLSEKRQSFLSQMTHELRTPMNAITSLTWFIAHEQYGPVNQDQVEVLQQITHTSKFLTSLVNDTLDLSKIEAGIMAFAFEDVPIEPIIGKAVKLVAYLIGDNPVTIDIYCEPNLPTAYANERRLSQIILNLISNAAKFTPEGFIKIKAQTAGKDILISIQDSGVGIPEEMREKIFENFVQADNSPSFHLGTGLGLPIAKELVELHRGKIWLESEIGVGTTFFVQIPTTNPHNPQI